MSMSPRPLRPLAAASAFVLALSLPGAASAQQEPRKDQGSAAQQDQRKDQGSGQKQAQRGTQAAQQDDAFVVLVPHVVVTDVDLGDGCWARLYDAENYDGGMLSVVGPVSLPDLRTEFGEFGRKYDSIEVGPKAKLTVYDNENYRQRTATFEAGQRVPDLDEKLGLFENIRSMRMSCIG